MCINFLGTNGTAQFVTQGSPGGSVVKNLSANAKASGDMCLIPGWGRSPGGGNSNPLQYSWLKKPMNGGDWQATDHGVPKSWTQLCNCACTHAVCYECVIKIKQ